MSINVISDAFLIFFATGCNMRECGHLCDNRCPHLHPTPLPSFSHRYHRCHCAKLQMQYWWHGPIPSPGRIQYRKTAYLLPAYTRSLSDVPHGAVAVSALSHLPHMFFIACGKHFNGVSHDLIDHIQHFPHLTLSVLAETGPLFLSLPG